MKESISRPISRSRLERLAHGRRLRLSSSARQIAEQIDAVKVEIEQLESNYRLGLESLESSHAMQEFQTITEWDKQRMQSWDQAELTSYRVASETQQQEKSLKERAKAELDQVQREASNRLSDIEKRHAKAVEAANKKLASSQERCSKIARIEQSLEQAALTALAKHALPTPAVEPSTQPDSAKESSEAFALAEAAIKSAQQYVHRLEHLPLVQFFSSAIWWTICAVVYFVSTAILHSMTQLDWVLSAAVAAAITGTVILTTLLGVRPWLKRSAAAEYPRLKDQLKLSHHFRESGNQLAQAELQQEIAALDAKLDRRSSEVHHWKDTQTGEIKEKVQAAVVALRAQAHEQKILAAKELDQGLMRVDDQFKARVHQEAEAAKEEKSISRERLTQRRNALMLRIDALNRSGSQRLEGALNKASLLLQANENFCRAAFPDWQNFEGQTVAWPEPVTEPILPLGLVNVNCGTAEPKQTVQTESATLLFSPLQDNYLVVYGDPNRVSIKQLVRSLVLRALTVLPAGKTQVCVAAPPGLGRDFGWLMALGDFDPSLVSHRVWTQTSHISKQLQNLASAAEDFIQQSLRNQYQDIVQYNRDAGGLSEPFRILVWNSLPSGLDEQSWKGLQSILDTGARCGIIPILIVDPDMDWSGPQLDLIERRGLHLRLVESGQFQVSSQRIADWTLSLEAPPTEAQSNRVIQEVGRRAIAASRVEVPLSRMLDFIQASSVESVRHVSETLGQSDHDVQSASRNPSASPRLADDASGTGLAGTGLAGTGLAGTGLAGTWQADSSRFLEIPIGQSGVGRIHSMKLGVGTAQHAIIAGKTGSGKSSLLHALITSALLKYSPESLRLVLLDFKKGVEFQVYSDASIAHIDIIGIESHREFGLSTLQYIDECLQRRGELFRSSGAQDIASWNTANPERSLPRMLLVIDEFQELFVEDDKLSQAASLILDRIVRQGRSFGVHAVLSSQTLAGSYSLPRTTLGQMAVRIALQCDPSDAQIIFSEDNPAAARLKHPGQAIYNDAGGRIEGNQPMQIGWLDKKTQVEWFSMLPQGYQNRDATTNLLGRTVIYDGNRPSTWDESHVDLAIQKATQQLNADAIWCAAGESVAISPAVVFPLTNQSGRNVLIVGGEDAMAASVMSLITHCFVRGALRKGQTPQIVAVQGAKPTDAHALNLPSVWKLLPCPFTLADSRDAAQTISKVHGWLQERMVDDEQQHPPVLLHLIQLSRLRSLRKEEEFSFGQAETTPDKQLEEILRDGPSHGIHLLIWAESYSTISRWLPRTALREMEIRLLMQMSTGDSANLVDTVAAAKLGEHIMLLYDEATGQEQKFRPYSSQSLENLGDWVQFGQPSERA